MKNLLFLLPFLLIGSLMAQSNYVANTASGTSAAPYITLVGVQAGININASGQSNVFTGYQAGFSTTSGAFTIYSGVGGGYNNTTGSQRVGVGHQAGVGGGSDVIAIGYQAGKANTTW